MLTVEEPVPCWNPKCMQFALWEFLRLKLNSSWFDASLIYCFIMSWVDNVENLSLACQRLAWVHQVWLVIIFARFLELLLIKASGLVSNMVGCEFARWPNRINAHWEVFIKQVVRERFLYVETFTEQIINSHSIFFESSELMSMLKPLAFLRWFLRVFRLAVKCFLYCLFFTMSFDLWWGLVRWQRDAVYWIF